MKNYLYQLTPNTLYLLTWGGVLLTLKVMYGN